MKPFDDAAVPLAEVNALWDAIREQKLPNKPVLLHPIPPYEHLPAAPLDYEGGRHAWSKKRVRHMLDWLEVAVPLAQAETLALMMVRARVRAVPHRGCARCTRRSPVRTAQRSRHAYRVQWDGLAPAP